MMQVTHWRKLTETFFQDEPSACTKDVNPSQMTDFGLFQTERVCRQQFQI